MLKRRPTGKSRKYCQSRWEPSCRVWPEPEREFESHFAALRGEQYRAASPVRLTRATSVQRRSKAWEIEVGMSNAMKLAISVVALVAACLAQEGLTIDNKHREKVSISEVEKIYSS